VFARGLERREIFGDDRDRGYLLELLGEIHERYRVRVHAYVLMDNHYHAILSTPDANLSGAMQWMHGSYAAWYNARHDRVGPLFQGRFRAIPIEDGAWAYALSQYVHLNLLRISGLGLDHRGRMMEGKGYREPKVEEVRERWKRLRGYRWSSYRAYAGYEAGPKWLEIKTLLACADKNPGRRQARYREAVRYRLSYGVDSGHLEGMRDAVALGSAMFARRIREGCEKQKMHGISGRREWRRQVRLEEVRGVVEQLKGQAWECAEAERGGWGRSLFRYEPDT